MRNSVRVGLLTVFTTTLGAQSPGGANLVGVTPAREFVAVNLANGLATVLAPYPQMPEMVAMALLNGAYYGSLDNWFVTVDPAAGVVTPVNTFQPAGVRINSMAADPTSGVLYGLDSWQNPPRLYQIDPATGATQFVGDTGLANRTQRGLAIDSAGNAYAWDTGPQGTLTGRGLVAIDLTTGVATDVNPLENGLGVTDMAFAGEVLYASVGPTLRVVDTVSGELRGQVAMASGLVGMAFTSPASVRAHGVGCLGTTYTPTLIARSIPELGSTFELRLELLAASAAAAVLGDRLRWRQFGLRAVAVQSGPIRTQAHVCVVDECGVLAVLGLAAQRRPRSSVCGLRAADPGGSDAGRRRVLLPGAGE